MTLIHPRGSRCASDVVEVVETYVYLLFMSVVTVARCLQSGPPVW